MIRHLFTLLWKKKKAHSLLIIEIWASFMVLFGLSALIVYNVRNYVVPLGFSYDTIWSVSLGNNEDTTAVGAKTDAVLQRLKAYPEVESATRMSDNAPFAAYHNNMGVMYDKVITQMEHYVTDDQFAKTLSIPIMAGAWFSNTDSIGKYKPLVINQKASESLFGSENPIGKLISDYTGKTKIWRVVGVVKTFKGRGEFSLDKPVMFELLRADNIYDKTVLIRVKHGTNAFFEARLVHDIAALAKGWSVDVHYLTNARDSQSKTTLVPIIIAAIISAFLLINVVLGLFGVLNLSIASRRGEIGLRRALGATGRAVSAQFVGEMWVLTTFALVLGLLLAGQFPLLNVFDLPASVYLAAMAVSVLIIYGLVTLCALFPSRQAAKIQPATALHEE